MTSKEFIRRFEDYSSLNIAAKLFETAVVDFIYRVSMVDNQNRKIVSYCLNPKSFIDLKTDNCQYLIFDRFDKISMRIQARYFEAFYNRCSARQKEILLNSPSLSSLFHYK